MIGIGMEALIFLYAGLGGMMVLFAYYVLICFRHIVKHSTAAAGVEDILFWLAASGFIFKQMYDTTYGSVRWFFVLGLLSGGGVGACIIRLGKKINVKFQKKLEKSGKNR